MTWLCIFQIYVHTTEDLKGPYSRDECVKAVDEWSQSEEALQLVRERGGIGGYYNYPLLPCSLHDYTENYREKEELKVRFTKV